VRFVLPAACTRGRQVFLALRELLVEGRHVVVSFGQGDGDDRGIGG